MSVELNLSYFDIIPSDLCIVIFSKISSIHDLEIMFNISPTVQGLVYDRSTWICMLKYNFITVYQKIESLIKEVYVKVLKYIYLDLLDLEASYGISSDIFKNFFRYPEAISFTSRLPHTIVLYDIAKITLLKMEYPFYYNILNDKNEMYDVNYNGNLSPNYTLKYRYIKNLLQDDSPLIKKIRNWGATGNLETLTYEDTWKDIGLYKFNNLGFEVIGFTCALLKDNQFDIKSSSDITPLIVRLISGIYRWPKKYGIITDRVNQIKKLNLSEDYNRILIRIFGTVVTELGLTI